MSNIENDVQIQEKEAKLAELDQQIADKTKDKEAVEALGKEKDRILTDVSALRETRRKEEANQLTTFRNENLQKAKQNVMLKFGYKSEEMPTLEDEFKKIDSGAVSADLIEKDYIKAHIALNPERYLKAEEELNRLKSSGDVMVADASTMASMGAGEGMPAIADVQLTPEDIEAARFSGTSLEIMKDLKRRGKI